MNFFSLYKWCLRSFCLLAVLAAGCMRRDDLAVDDFDTSGHGLFVVNEGNFQYGNASLSFYNPLSREVFNEVFLRANGMKLGDVAQSMTVFDNKGWIVVNNSHVIFAIDVNSFREVGRIENLSSPRYIHFVSESKAYVSNLWDNRISIVNPATYEVSGFIEVPGMAMESGSTEQMVSFGDFVFCNCWSYQNRIIKIDTATDRVVADLVVGLQPSCLVLDGNGKLWTISDGGFEGNPLGYEAPALFCIDPVSFEVVKRFDFKLGDRPGKLHLNGDGSKLFWINDDVWQMDVNALSLPEAPFIDTRATLYYGLAIDPLSGDVYIADAIDYQQPGKIYRYSSSGLLLDEFYAGVNPNAFCFKFN